MHTNEIYIGQRLGSPLGIGRVLDISDDREGVLLLYQSGMSQWQEPEVLEPVDPAQPTREGLIYYAYDPQIPPSRDRRWEARRRLLFTSPALECLINITYGDIESAPNRHCHVWLDTSQARLPEAADIILERYNERYPGMIHELVVETDGDEAKLARAAGQIISDFIIQGYVDRKRRDFILLRITQSNGYNVQLLDLSASAERRLDLVQLLIGPLRDAYQQSLGEPHYID